MIDTGLDGVLQAVRRQGSQAEVQEVEGSVAAAEKGLLTEDLLLHGC